METGIKLMLVCVIVNVTLSAWLVMYPKQDKLIDPTDGAIVLVGGNGTLRGVKHVSCDDHGTVRCKNLKVGGISFMGNIEGDPYDSPLVAKDGVVNASSGVVCSSDGTVRCRSLKINGVELQQPVRSAVQYPLVLRDDRMLTSGTAVSSDELLAVVRGSKIVPSTVKITDLEKLAVLGKNMVVSSKGDKIVAVDITELVTRADAGLSDVTKDHSVAAVANGELSAGPVFDRENMRTATGVLVTDDVGTIRFADPDDFLTMTDKVKPSTIAIYGEESGSVTSTDYDIITSGLADKGLFGMKNGKLQANVALQNTHATFEANGWAVNAVAKFDTNLKPSLHSVNIQGAEGGETLSLDENKKLYLERIGNVTASSTKWDNKKLAVFTGEGDRQVQSSEYELELGKEGYLTCTADNKLTVLDDPKPVPTRYELGKLTTGSIPLFQNSGDDVIVVTDSAMSTDNRHTVCVSKLGQVDFAALAHPTSTSQLVHNSGKCSFESIKVGGEDINNLLGKSENDNKYLGYNAVRKLEFMDPVIRKCNSTIDIFLKVVANSSTILSTVNIRPKTYDQKVAILAKCSGQVQNGGDEEIVEFGLSVTRTGNSSVDDATSNIAACRAKVTHTGATGNAISPVTLLENFVAAKYVSYVVHLVARKIVGGTNPFNVDGRVTVITC